MNLLGFGVYNVSTDRLDLSFQGVINARFQIDSWDVSNDRKKKVDLLAKHAAFNYLLEQSWTLDHWQVFTNVQAAGFVLFFF